MRLLPLVCLFVLFAWTADARASVVCEPTPSAVVRVGSSARVLPACRDSDQSTFVTYTVARQPRLGFVEQEYYYAPADGATTEVDFDYDASVDDGPPRRWNMRVRLVPADYDTAPVCFPTRSKIAIGQSGSILPWCEDYELDRITYSLVSDAAHGHVTVADGGVGFQYAPDAGYAGADSFVYRADDGHGGTRQQTAQVAVGEANNPGDFPPLPWCLGGIFNLHPDSTVGIDPMCHGDLPTDAEVTVVFAPEHGTLTGSYPHWRYTPDADVGDRASDTAAVGYETAEGRLWTFVMRFEIDRGLWPYSGITRAPRASTYATDATFEFAGGVSYRCKLDDAPFAACGQVKTYSGLTPGVRRLSVVAYDEARDISATPAIYEWTVKRTPADATVTEGDVGTDGGIVTGGGVSVEVPAGTAGGPVAIVRQPVTFAAPSGYTNIGRELQIEAPAATAANPLRLTFDIDASTLTAAGVDEQTVAIVRDGVVVAPCTAADGSATPDPCVSGRARTATGASIVVLSPHASRWNAAKPGEPTPSAPPATSPGPAPSASPSPTVAPSPTPTFTPPVVTTPPDTSAPIVGLSASRQRVTAVLKRGLRVQLTSTEPCTALVVVTFRGKAVGSAPAALATGGSVAVRVTAARRALRAAKRPRLGVILSATDPAGNVATRTAAVRLRRG